MCQLINKLFLTENKMCNKYIIFKTMHGSALQ